MQIESIKWSQSDTMKASIGVVATAFVAFVASMGLLFGHPLDDSAQLHLTQVILTGYTVVNLGLGWWATQGRLNTNTVIEGSKGEKAVIAATGVTPAPKGTADGTNVVPPAVGPVNLPGA